MPPRRRKRKANLAATTTDDHTVEASASAHEAIVNDTHVTPLANLPAELFDEIVSYFPTLALPLNFYAAAAPEPVPSEEYGERTKVLRALSQSCKALRHVAFPRQWDRLDLCFVPERMKSVWYKYVNDNLRKKADGVISSGPQVQDLIRTLTFTVSKYNLHPTLASLQNLLQKLPNLRTIQIVACKSPGSFTTTMAPLKFPSVRTLHIPSDTHSLIKSCPNVTHVRCVGGTGTPMIGSLKGCKCEVLGGMIDWREPKLVDRLIKSAPSIRKLEIGRPVTWGLPYHDPVPMQWVTMIPKLSKLPNLLCLQLTFPEVEPKKPAVDGEEDEDGDSEEGQEKEDEEEDTIEPECVAAARKVLQNSKVKGEKKLIIRRVVEPHYTNNYKEGYVQSCREELFM